MVHVGQLTGPMIDPANNNRPLDFDTNKGKPPMAQHPQDMDERDNPMANTMRDPTSPEDPEGLNHVQIGPGIMGPWPGQMMMNDPNMMMNMSQYGQYGGFIGSMAGPEINAMQKEVMTFKSSILYPPPPNVHPPSTRERPPGCRTVFVGGLPETMTEEHIREIFDSFGTIVSLRMSKKNFVHIRYVMEESVDKALFLSGYRIKIENKDDKENTGRIHVDYAQARDDLYEWECKQRSLARELRHRQRMEENRLRPPSPPPIIHYTEHEASVLHENLKGEESFMAATQVLVTWLERGDCTRRNANTFYSMVQSVNSHIRRLLNEKAVHDNELEQMKFKFRQRLEGILHQFEQIENIFTTVTKQKSWDHFSKAQRKNLDTWKKQCQETFSKQQQEFFKDREEAEMEMSDSEEDGLTNQVANKKRRVEDVQASAIEWMQMSQLRDENDQVKCQLEAYKNEVDLLKQESIVGTDDKDKQIKALQNALQGMQHQLIVSRKDSQELKTQIQLLKAQELTRSIEEANKSSTLQQNGEVEKETESSEISAGKSAEEKEKPAVVESPKIIHVPVVTSKMNEKDAKLIGVIATFLHVHPFGATVDYISSYLSRLGIVIRSSELEDLLEQLPTVFTLEIKGVGASIEKLWTFTAFSLEKNTES